MGIFSVNIEIGDPHGDRYRPLQVVVGTGAAFSRAPRQLLEELGVRPERTTRFRTADNRLIERPVGKTWIRLEGHQFTTPVVFGKEGEASLLGAIALEEAMLAADPHNRTLTPVDGWLLYCDTWAAA